MQLFSLLDGESVFFHIAYFLVGLGVFHVQLGLAAPLNFQLKWKHTVMSEYWNRKSYISLSFKLTVFFFQIWTQQKKKAPASWKMIEMIFPLCLQHWPADAVHWRSDSALCADQGRQQMYFCWRFVVIKEDRKKVQELICSLIEFPHSLKWVTTWSL